MCFPVRNQADFLGRYIQNVHGAQGNGVIFELSQEWPPQFSKEQYQPYLLTTIKALHPEAQIIMWTYLLQFGITMS